MRHPGVPRERIASIPAVHVCLVIPASGEHADHVIDAVRRTAPDAELLGGMGGRSAAATQPAVPRRLDRRRTRRGGRARLEPNARRPAAGVRTSSGAARPRSPGCCGRRLSRWSCFVSDRSRSSTPLDGFVTSSGVTVAVRRATPFPVDGLAPAAADLALAGRFSTAIVGFGGDSSNVAEAIALAALGRRAELRPRGVVRGRPRVGRSARHRTIGCRGRRLERRRPLVSGRRRCLPARRRRTVASGVH